ncbi:MAG: DUF4492 domain-containing protein [Porphyromonas sp.]|nr:DUF4492 domain-containing protein [Porphyromonas sp.]
METNNREDKVNTLVPQKKGFFPKLFQLWKEGFRTMTWGKPLWILNIIKLLILFGVLRLFFFPDFLKEQSDTEEGRGEYVRNELVQRAQEPATVPATVPAGETMEMDEE